MGFFDTETWLRRTDETPEDTITMQDVMQADADFYRSMYYPDLQKQTMSDRAMMERQMEEQEFREAEAVKQRGFLTGERLGGQEFQTGERLGGEEFTAGESALERLAREEAAADKRDFELSKISMQMAIKLKSDYRSTDAQLERADALLQKHGVDAPAGHLEKPPLPEAAEKIINLIKVSGLSKEDKKTKMSEVYTAMARSSVINTIKLGDSLFEYNLATGEVKFKVSDPVAMTKATAAGTEEKPNPFNERMKMIEQDLQTLDKGFKFGKDTNFIGDPTTLPSKQDIEDRRQEILAKFRRQGLEAELARVSGYWTQDGFLVATVGDITKKRTGEWAKRIPGDVPLAEADKPQGSEMTGEVTAGKVRKGNYHGEPMKAQGKWYVWNAYANKWTTASPEQIKYIEGSIGGQLTANVP